MQIEWWYATAEGRNGPVAEETLAQLLSAGTISDDTLVWRNGMTGWARLAEVPELARHPRAIPPPVPAPQPGGERERLISLSPAGPWRRFFARMIDLWIVGIPTIYIVSYLLARHYLGFALWIQRPGSDFSFGWVMLPPILAVEACIHRLFGNTFGKALLKVVVITADARRPTFGEYLRRQLGVYWYGLGTGFPLVPLFTMFRQYGKLKSGGQATYDRGAFNVKARKLGVLRGCIAFVVVVMLFFAVGMLNILSKEGQRSYYSGTLWKNPVSGKQVPIPQGWLLADQHNSDRQPIHVFTAPDLGVQMVFAQEDAGPRLPLGEYARLWQSAVANVMALQRDGPAVVLDGREVIVLTGTMTNDKALQVRVTLTKSDRYVWRCVIVTNGDKDAAAGQALKLQSLLFRSIDANGI
ncbi:RDD family protein [Bordetella sputigena]|uniref:RDD family protein n=1 Tax=Bordetella sputigena TaxID=1416810 RepID=UPI0039EE5FAA